MKTAPLCQTRRLRSMVRVSRIFAETHSFELIPFDDVRTRRWFLFTGTAETSIRLDFGQPCCASRQREAMKKKDKSHNSRGFREFRGDVKLGTAFAKQRVEQTAGQAEVVRRERPRAEQRGWLCGGPLFESVR